MRRDVPPDHWTPELVEERLIEAVRFAGRIAGRVGPAGIGSGMPDFRPTIEDFLEEGWGLPAPPDEEEETTPALPSPEQVTRMIAALSWVADLLAPDHPGRARAVNAWIFAQAHYRPFAKVARERGLSRSFAYTMRDQGLSILSQKLQASGVPPWPES